MSYFDTLLEIAGQSDRSISLPCLTVPSTEVLSTPWSQSLWECSSSVSKFSPPGMICTAICEPHVSTLWSATCAHDFIFALARFEILIATINAFLAAALASTGHFCYTAVASSSIVLILPGYIVLTGALELASRNITAGATRIAYSVIYSLFLGFGLS